MTNKSCCISTSSRPVDLKGGYWLFFGCYNRGLRRRKLDNPGISLLLSFVVKKVYYIKCWRSRRDTTKSLCLPKINTKMPTRTKSVEINKILTNSEIRLHHCICQSSCFKTGKNSHRRCSIKKLFPKILQNWQKSICVRVRHRFFSRQFYKIIENTFYYRTLPGNCFWWIGLMVKTFNSMSLIFLNSQHFIMFLPEWWLFSVTKNTF